MVENELALSNSHSLTRIKRVDEYYVGKQNAKYWLCW